MFGSAIPAGLRVLQFSHLIKTVASSVLSICLTTRPDLSSLIWVGVGVCYLFASSTFLFAHAIFSSMVSRLKQSCWPPFYAAAISALIRAIYWSSVSASFCAFYALAAASWAFTASIASLVSSLFVYAEIFSYVYSYYNAD